MKPYADLHCHPTMHPFAFAEVGKKRKNTMWWDNPPLKRQRKSEFPEYFQMSMPALARGNVRVVVAALYPIEQSWLRPKKIGTGSLVDFFAKQVVCHLPERFINIVQSQQFNYFKYLQKEYKFLLKENGIKHRSEGKEWQYLVVGTGDELREALAEDSNIVVIPAIEGAHSIISSNAQHIIDEGIDLYQTIQNIEKIKRWEYPPFYITLAHHFYNGITGHARSIPDGIASVLLQQSIGLNEPVNDLGEEVVDCLLSINKYNGNGRRILIDTKHMSISARIWYYNKIKAYNASNPDDMIPVLASHMGYGNHKTMLNSIDKSDLVQNKYEKSTIYNPWSINLSDEEVLCIFETNGLIGINLDQRILSGNEVIDVYKDSFKSKDIKNNTDEVVEFWTNQIARNILSIVHVVDSSLNIAVEDKPKIWDCICIGSDFDGMINPVDAFITADEFPNLRVALQKYMPKLQLFERLKYHYTVDEILDKIMCDNVYDFIVKHYR